MTDKLPSTTQIDNATVPLRQALTLAIQVEAICSYAPDYVVDAHKAQLLHNLHDVARALGLELASRSSPRLAVDNDADDQPITMGR
jgi:hypothetical protein